jgi:hypothetical protein
MMEGTKASRTEEEMEEGKKKTTSREQLDIIRTASGGRKDGKSLGVEERFHCSRDWQTG